MESARSNITARVTQRAPQSCTTCYQRKMRCSKTVPCEACVSQGTAQTCRREQVVVTKDLRVSVERSPGTRNKTAGARQRHRQVLKQGKSTLWTPQSYQSPRNGLNAFGIEHSLDPRATEGPDPFDPTCQQYSSRATVQHADGVRPHGGEPGIDSLRQDVWTGKRAVPEDLWNKGSSPMQSPSESDTEQVSPFDGTTTTLEYLVWGRTCGGAATALVGVAVDDLLLPQHATAVLEYHRQWLAWTYNFIHWPHFIEECQAYWNEGVVKEKAWVALYYAMLCVGLHHMSTDQRIQLGVPTDSGLTERLYRRCLSSLTDAQYAAVHSIRSVQAICLLVLCAHDFDGSNNLTVLLSSAIRVAQALGIHRLGPDALTQKSPEDMLQREISKSIWMFLTTQDWFLIPFSSAYSISPRHCTTPLPANCNAIAGFSGKIGSFNPVPPEQPTHMSFLLAMFRIAEVYRAFFDETITLSESQSKEESLRALYEQVLKADSELRAIYRSLSRTTQPRYDLRDPQMPQWLQRQRYHFTISVAHKRLTIHHAFFLKSLVDNWYNYTKVACMACARTILTELRNTSSDGPSQNLWTVTAHAVSASIILLLAMLLSEDDGSCDDAVANRQLVCDCLEILRRSTKSSSLTTRGIDLIELLLTKSHAGNLASRALDVKEIAAYLAADRSKPFPAAMTGSVVQFDPVDLDEWMHSLGMSFEPSGI